MVNIFSPKNEFFLSDTLIFIMSIRKQIYSFVIDVDVDYVSSVIKFTTHKLKKYTVEIVYT